MFKSLSFLFIFSVLFSTSLFGEIKVIKDSSNFLSGENPYIVFEKDKVVSKKYKRIKGFINDGFEVISIDTFSYEEYLTKMCDNRKYEIIGTDFGGSFNSFVVNCKDK